MNGFKAYESTGTSDDMLFISSSVLVSEFKVKNIKRMQRYDVIQILSLIQ